MSGKPVLVIKNDANEGPGLLGRLMEQRGLKYRTVTGFEDGVNGVQSDDFSALVVLGGVQSAYETDTYPYLKQEMELCQGFMASGKPIVGFCLGAQILAHMLGGEVCSGAQKEIGWYDLSMTDAAANDPLTRDLPKSFNAYHFHGDIIRPPAEFTNLASSEMTACQLFRYGSNVYGFQYHAEADRPLIESMLRNNADYLASNGIDMESILAEAQTRSDELERNSSVILNRWIDLVAK